MWQISSAGFSILEMPPKPVGGPGGDRFTRERFRTRAPARLAWERPRFIGRSGRSFVLDNWLLQFADMNNTSRTTKETRSGVFLLSNSGCCASLLHLHYRKVTSIFTLAGFFEEKLLVQKGGCERWAGSKHIQRVLGI